MDSRSVQHRWLNFDASRHGSALDLRCGVQEGNALHDVMSLALVKSCRVWCCDWMCHKHVELFRSSWLMQRIVVAVVAVVAVVTLQLKCVLNRPPMHCCCQTGRWLTVVIVARRGRFMGSLVLQEAAAAKTSCEPNGCWWTSVMMIMIDFP